MKSVKAAPRVRTRASASTKARRATSKSTLVLDVQYATRSHNVPSTAQFRKWIAAALQRDARITIRVVGQAEGRELNRTYRGRDYATNVLTFVMRERPPYDGDLALCAPVVSREARAQRKSIMAHYAHLTVHGVLHLQGYLHETDADADEMESLETGIMNRLGYADPYLPHPTSHARKSR